MISKAQRPITLSKWQHLGLCSRFPALQRFLRLTVFGMLFHPVSQHCHIIQVGWNQAVSVTFVQKEGHCDPKECGTHKQTHGFDIFLFYSEPSNLVSHVSPGKTECLPAVITASCLSSLQQLTTQDVGREVPQESPPFLRKVVHWLSVSQEAGRHNWPSTSLKK